MTRRLTDDPPAPDPDEQPPREDQGEEEIGEDEAAANEEIEDRLEEANADDGAMTISLAWDSDADLDLQIECPDGTRIGARTPAACGGVRDVDANSAGQISDAPVENVAFADDPAPGTYAVVIDNFNSRSDGDTPTPYRVRIQRGDQVEILDGEIGAYDGRVRVAEISIP